MLYSRWVTKFILLAERCPLPTPCLRYGIELEFGHVAVAPMPNKPFNYHIGNVNVDYNPNGTSVIRVPPSGAAGRDREFRLAGMQPNSTYVVTAAADCDAAQSMRAPSRPVHAELGSDAAGGLRFRAHAHCGVSVTLQRGQASD